MTLSACQEAKDFAFAFHYSHDICRQGHCRNRDNLHYNSLGRSNLQ